MSGESKSDMSMFEDDFTNLDMIAIQFNELYRSLQRGGFRQDEALELIGMIMSNNMSYGPPMQEEDFSSEEEFPNDGEFSNEFDDEDGEDFV
jgi:hypothetical protein